MPAIPRNVVYEVIFTHHVSWSFWIGNTAQGQLARTGKRIEVTKIIVPVQMSLIQVRF